MKKLKEKLKTFGTVVSLGTLLMTVPKVSEAQSPYTTTINLGYRPNALVTQLADSVRNKPTSSRSISDIYGIPSISYIRVINSGGLEYVVAYVDRSYGVNGVSSGSDGRVGQGDDLILMISQMGQIKYFFIDKNLDGNPDDASFPQEDQENSRITSSPGEKSARIYLARVLETLNLLKNN